MADKKPVNVRFFNGVQRLVLLMVALLFIGALLVKYQMYFYVFGCVAAVVLGIIAFFRIRRQLRARQQTQANNP